MEVVRAVGAGEAMIGSFHLLWGLHLATHRRLSSDAPPAESCIPPHLIIPLLQRGGRPAEPSVRQGDRVARGQVIAGAGDRLAPPIHASSSGVVAEIRELPLPHASALVGPCVVIATDGLDRTVTLPPIDDYRSVSSAALRTRIHQAGIVGLGGAAYPTAAKLESAGPIDTLILNGAECEPYITCDDILMRHRPEEVIAGARILMAALGIEQCLLGIGQDMPEAIAALTSALERRGDSGIAITPVPAIYPTGGERQLTRVLTGRRVPAGGLPRDVGVVCQNVATAAAVFHAVVNGEPLTSRIVTVTGQGVIGPRNLAVRIGTPIADLISQCGGYTDDVECLIHGGPMMGFTLQSDTLPVTCGTNCILAAAAGELPARGEIRACIRCGACEQVCPAELLPQQLYWYARSKNLQRVQDYRLFDCIECGCCDVVCPSHIPLAQQFREAKYTVSATRESRDRAEHARVRFEARNSRRERARLQQEEQAVRRKEALKNPGAAEIAAAIQRARTRKTGMRPAADSAVLGGSCADDDSTG